VQLFERITPINADLGLSMQAPTGSVARVQNLAYSLTVTNLGPANATGVTLTNSLPATVTLFPLRRLKGRVPILAALFPATLAIWEVPATPPLPSFVTP